MPTLIVTLDQTTSPWSLNVSSPQVEVDTYPTTITWQLSGMPSGASWSTNAQNPGFTWLGSNKPPPGTFTNPGINGTDLSATDNGGTGGPWPYQLCVALGSGYYRTSNVLLPIDTQKAPKIQNN